jgi:hypothetical protein
MRTSLTCPWKETDLVDAFGSTVDRGGFVRCRTYYYVDTMGDRHETRVVCKLVIPHFSKQQPIKPEDNSN